MIRIEDSDINYAEKKLLPEECTFDDERRQFIRSMSSCDVVACPGSGKTTALLAKLIILQRKMPFQSGGGICVLTHTNVAIDEVKNRLGAAAGSLMAYPNFFGTIQAFTNRFLGTPCFREVYGMRPSIIDTSRYLQQLAKECRASSVSGWLYQKLRTGHYADLDELLAGVRYDPCSKQADLSKLRLKDATRPTHKKITACCQHTVESGVISYEQAYVLAQHYIKQHPCISELISKRFRYVLIDEMQDTDEKQLALLDTLFSDNTNVVLQRVGDPNQAIFNSVKGGEMTWMPRKETLSFSNSMRFGDNIANPLTSVRLRNDIPLSGNPEISSKAPYLITYDDSNVENVVEAFGQLVQNVLLDDPTIIERINSPVIKAVGWVGKVKKGVSIPSYHPTFKRVSKKESEYFNFYSYFIAYEGEYCNSANPKAFNELFWAGFFQGTKDFFRKQNCKTPKQAEKWIKAQSLKSWKKIRQYISKAVLKLTSGVELLEVYQSMVSSLGADIFCKSHFFRGELPVFFTDTASDPNCKFDPECNEFSCSTALNISVGTVHSVKGETHTATLLMESKNDRKHDSEYLIDFLKGSAPQKAFGVYQKACLKIAHVAMSRPTHLFAMACHVDRIKGHEVGLKKNNWQLISANELLGIE
ncbi:UvrD-helicase domain-containing protein [Halodesulfovibrio spirochaetisodalis]|uniref:DNA 3'-5' helicase II n=1 Tax=Halodesulfovibrio spirochaetisodalis TaxID=1560234 RepID=A0A1B7XI42_9BACT|nr:UvrD-helicase domain-containing protein [Halodesulfovibrio spirochaetisodalis]OBQ55192.1 hypothetical protein SP90_04285 [Halodesulfovibrio spirochaetisodalis]